MVVMNEPRCGPCSRDQHDGCSRDPIGCTCYAYSDIHVTVLRVVSSFGRVRHLPAYDEVVQRSDEAGAAELAVEAYRDLDVLDVDHDDGDGGLGSGRWLMGEMP